MNNECTIAAAVPVENREILPIFIQEARGILGHHSHQVPTLRAAPHKREVLEVVRRGFHTLKGSSRMIGLEALALVAWEVEQVLNQHLRTEDPAEPEVLTLVELASAAFQGWIEELETRGQAQVASASLTQLAQRLRTKLPPGRLNFPQPGVAHGQGNICNT